MWTLTIRYRVFFGFYSNDTDSAYIKKIDNTINEKIPTRVNKRLIISTSTIRDNKFRTSNFDIHKKKNVSKKTIILVNFDTWLSSWRSMKIKSKGCLIHFFIKCIKFWDSQKTCKKIFLVNFDTNCHPDWCSIKIKSKGCLKHFLRQCQKFYGRDFLLRV